MQLTYLVRGNDGNQYGPASLQQLTSWIREGRVPPTQEVQRSDMQHWAPAEAFLELQPAFGIAPVAAETAPSDGGTAVATATRPVAAQGTRKGDPATVGQLRSGGSWFYWVAGLSLVNTVLGLAGAKIQFIFGLAITQVFDGVAVGMGGSGKIVAILLDLVVAGIFVLFGVYATKGHLWAFIVGMILFALDGLIFLLFKDWLSVGFHAFVLYCLFRGLAACRELRSA
jgi:hypothetical protein